MTDHLTDTNVGNIEYIRREDALECVTYDVEYTTEQIKGLPSADVVPVVRCKDCKHHAYDEIFSSYWCEYPGRVRDTTPDGFCEKGEE